VNPQRATDDEASFWSIGAKEAAPVHVDSGEELLSGDEEMFDPATGWNYAVVGGGASTEPDDINTQSALAAISLAGMAAVSRSHIPAVQAAPPAADPADRALAPNTGDVSHLPTFKTSGRWAKPPDAPPPPILEAPRAAPAPRVEEEDDGLFGASDDGRSEPGAEPGFQTLDEPADEPTEETVRVEFDDDGFFSIADVAAPVVHAESFFVEEESVYDIGPIEDDPACPASEVVRLDATGEFDFQIEVTPEHGEDVFSQTTLPALPPELLTLSVDDAIQKAQQLFLDGEADLGMALLEATIMAHPDDNRLATWLEYGERRLISAYCPTGRPDRVAILRQPRGQLLVVTAGSQHDLIAVIDGRTTVRDLRRKLPHVPVVAFWKELGKLTQRGWLGWAD
jgi:hypothetical protein